MTEAERNLAYVDGLLNHHDPQLRQLFATIYGPGRAGLEAEIKRERAEKTQGEHHSE